MYLGDGLVAGLASIVAVSGGRGVGGGRGGGGTGQESSTDESLNF